MGSDPLEIKRGDLQATGLIFDQAQASTPESTYAENQRGTEAADAMVAPNNRFELGLGGDPDKGMQEAIRNKYMRGYNDQKATRLHADRMNAKAQHFEKLQHTTQLVAQEQQMNYEKALEKLRREQASRAARGNIVGQVLGIVAGVVAGIYTGGAGAAAGYAAGSAAGNAIGGAE